MVQHFLSIGDYSRDWIERIFDVTVELKNKNRKKVSYRPLEGKNLGMIFAKPSMRTRVSFEVGMHQLGGNALYISAAEIQIGVRESFADVARVISRYVDIVMARLFAHEHIMELSQYCTIPVINGLTDLLHPCQVMADLFTVFEHKGKREDLTIVFIGDGNNVANSWLNMAGKYPMRFVMCSPEGYDPDERILAEARKAGVSEINIIRDPHEAARNADVLYTDVWVSMGDEAEASERMKAFRGYQVNRKILSLAKKDCLVLHCLPAHKGEEITEEVFESPNSVVFDEAENRMHVQKAIILTLLNAGA